MDLATSGTAIVDDLWRGVLANFVSSAVFSAGST